MFRYSDRNWAYGAASALIKEIDNKEFLSHIEEKDNGSS